MGRLTGRVLLILGVAVSFAPSLHGPGAVSAESVANMGAVAGPAAEGVAGVTGVTADWWAAVQATIEADPDLSGVEGLSQVPDWTATGQGPGDLFGFSVASAGDVNGDGYADVIVGAHGYADMFAVGKAYAFYGSASGLSGTADWTSVGEFGGSFGFSVAGAGDVNGDGYADVIVSAPQYTTPGRVYIFFGSASGLSNTWDWRESGEQNYDHFGISVAGAGDVNGDGYADVIVGADYHGGGLGKVYVYHGGASGPGVTWDWSETGDTAYLYLGHAVAGAGDVNGDGYADVIFSSTAYFDNRGVAYVHHGSASGLLPDVGWTDAGEYAGDRFGVSVATAGDVNGDGYADIIVGASGYDEIDDDDGKVYVYYGADGGLDPNPGWSTRGLTPGVDDRLGRSVASAGDVNGDGYADVLMGGKGAALMFYGAAAGPRSGWPDWFPSQGYWDEFGCSVAGAGDVNGDGYADVIVGAYGYEAGANQGRAYVYHGSADVLSGSPVWSDHGTYVAERFGQAVASAGDVNADGYGDVIVGAPGYPGPPGEQGKVYLYLGAAGGPSTTPAWSANGQYDGDWFGSAVAAAGDVNGDGHGDVIIGAWKYTNGTQPYAGKAYVYYGSESGLESTWAWSVTGDHENLNLGVTVAGAGDVNGDGYADVMVGATDQAAPGRGTVYVYHGSQTGLSTVPDWTQTGEGDWDHLGWSIASAGDVNGDGYADVILGTPYFGTENGRAYLYHGSAAGLGPTAAWSVTGVDSLDQVGYSVAGAGDVDGDGYADVLVGALKVPLLDYPGKAYLYSGSASGLSATADWTASGENDGDQFGGALSGAGDVNGDGYADVVIGARGCLSSRGKIYAYLGSATGLETAAGSSDVGEAEGDELGYSVASAGDVNGDAFADLVAGAPFRDEPVDTAGKAYLYFGNIESGRPIMPQQARADGGRVPVQPWGLSHTADAFYLGAWATDPMGRGRVKLEVEVCPPGVPFGDVSCVGNRSAMWKDVTASESGTQLFTTVSGLEMETLYRWRARVLYAPYWVVRLAITPPPNPAHGPWRRLQAQAFEADIRTAEGWRVLVPVVQKAQ